jgi:hypothetical protein
LESSTEYFDGTKHTIIHERQLGQLSSYIVARMVNFKWDDDEVRFLH